MSWQNILGHDPIVDHFRKVLSDGRMPHALLFVGPPSVGKSSFAHAFGRAMLCDNSTPEAMNPCGRCPACKQVGAETHPDFITVRRPEDKQELPVESIRELCVQLALKPMMGKFRVVVIEDADNMNEESANAFLKTLEEPGPGTILIMISASTDNQLDTVVSRCQVVRFQPLSTDDLEAILIEKQIISQTTEARRLAEQAEGSVARALALADDDYQDVRRSILYELVQSGSPLAPQIARLIEEHVKSCSKEPAANRRRAVLILEDVTRFFRDVLWNGAGLIAPSGDASWAESALSLAQFCEPEDIFILADRSRLAIAQIQSNGNTGLVLSAWASDVCRTLQQANAATRTKS